jgi:hypothetical protein
MAEGFRSRQAESGQAITEYVMLLVIVLILAGIIREGLRRYRVADQIAAPINKRFAYAYRYGDVNARGFDDGGPRKHPRATSGDGSFRLFLNPGRK